MTCSDITGTVKYKNSMDNFLTDNIDFDGKLVCSSNKTHILIVDYKLLKYTQHVISNLLVQDTKFDLTIFEQTPDNRTVDFMEDLKSRWNMEGCVLNIVYNSTNAPLNHVWNWFYRNTTNKYLAYLNNDIEICDNFVSDGEKIFSKENKCGIIVHPTNNPKYTKQNELEYMKDDTHFLQGWDFIIRRELYEPIPEELYIWSGDTYIFQKVFEKGYDEFYDISSPVLHYQSKTINGNKKLVNEQCEKDVDTFNKKYYNDTIIIKHGKTNSISNRKFQNIFPIDLTKKIIVSFTSWEKRIGNVKHVVEQMLGQTRKPDKIILNLSEEEFNGKENLLNYVKEMEDRIDIFEINMVSGPNTKVWKKWIPIIDKYKNDLIYTIDDDMEYPKDFIERLYNKWLKNPYNPISGDLVVLGDFLQCHCGAGSLIFRSAFGAYLDDYKKLMNKLGGSDGFYSFISYINGYNYIPEGMNVLKFNRVNEIEPYSKNKNRSLSKPVHIFDFEFLENNYKGDWSYKSYENFENEQNIQETETKKLRINQKYQKIIQLRKDIAEGRVVKTPIGNGKFAWKRVK